MAAVRRKTAWDDQILIGQTVVNAASPAGFLLVENAADPEKRGCTVVRIIVDLAVNADVPGSVSGQEVTSFGIALVSDDAFVAAAFPEPNDETDYPVSGWLWRKVILVQDETLATGPIPPVRVYQDLRVARKLDRASLTLIVMTQGIEGSTFNTRLTGIVRALYKLP